MNRILSKAIEFYGIDHQSMVAVEELSELQKEISKATRGKFDYNHMAEEIADICIVIEQMKMHYGISDKDIEKIAEEKIDRLLDTMMLDSLNKEK